MTHYFSTAEPYVNIKIKRNELLVKLLDMQNNIIKKEIIFNYRTLEINKKKIELINEINKTERKQAYNFQLDNEELLRPIYQKVNEMSVEDSELKSEITLMRKKLSDLLIQISDLNNQIPKILKYINVAYTFN